MTLYFEEEGDVKLPLECEALAKRVVEEALDYVGCPYEAEVNLLLTENAQIHEMNKEFRGIDRATDVLSFPMIDYPEPGTFDFLEEQEDCFDPESGELTLGDIVISKEKVLAQAEEYGHSPMREYAFLIAHSVLHLTGYDHMEDEERQVMEQKQREIMERLDILRYHFADARRDRTRNPQEPARLRPDGRFHALGDDGTQRLHRDGRGAGLGDAHDRPRTDGAARTDARGDAGHRTAGYAARAERAEGRQTASIRRARVGHHDRRARRAHPAGDRTHRRILPFAGALHPSVGGGDRRRDNRRDRTAVRRAGRPLRRGPQRRRRHGAPHPRSVSLTTVGNRMKNRRPLAEVSGFVFRGR